MNSALFDEAQLEILQRKGMRTIESDNKRRVYAERLNRLGSTRHLVQIPNLNLLDKLSKDMPNFSEVTDFVKGEVALRKFAPAYKRPMGLTPILLQGPPGVGKTRFAMKLAEVLKVEFHEIAFATTTASFVLKGSNLQWGEGQTGRIFEILADCEHLNPLILLDEVDKAIKSNYPPINVLYELLEPSQSVRFQDEALFPLTLNASHIMFILTANEPERIPEAILSRCRVFDIPIPGKNDIRDIAQSVYKDVIAGQPWAKRFEKKLSDEVVKKLTAMPPREMGKVIKEALGCAALKGLKAIPADAINSVKTTKKMGF